MIPIVSIEGKSDRGKTFLIGQLVSVPGSDRLLCTEANRLVALAVNHDVCLDLPLLSETEVPRWVDWVEERFLRGQGSGGRVRPLGTAACCRGIGDGTL